MELYQLSKLSANDLTSLRLAQQKNELVLIEDIIEHDAFNKFKESLQFKFPDGKIPKKNLDDFKKNRKVAQFQNFLKSELFKIIFRDTNFMQAVD
jgi:hypothetical protein